MAGAGMLVTDGALLLASGGLEVLVGIVLLRRRVDPASRHAMRMFALWWFGLAAVDLVGGAQDVAFVAGVTDLRAHLVALYLSAPPLSLALWGLLYYLTFLYTGNRRWLFPTGVLYGVLGGALVALYASAQATAVVAGAGHVGFAWARPPPGALGLGLALLVLLPVLGATLAYATLWRRVRDGEQRYRIALVAGALGVWLLATAMGSVAVASGGSGALLGARLLGLAVPAAALLAYRPPERIRRSLGFGLPAESN